MLPDFLLPYSGADTNNLSFRQMWLHLRLVNTESRFRRFNRLALYGIPFIAVLWWSFERLNVNFGYIQPDISYRLINFLLLITLVLMLMSSLYSIPSVFATFHHRFTSGFWETLRLTPQFNSTMLLTHDAIAQLRLWPFTAAEVGLRMAVVILFILNNFYAQFIGTDDHTLWLSQTLLSLFCWVGWGIAALVGLTFVLEPILRTRLVIGLHLITALFIRNTPLAVLSAILELILIHISQAVLITSLWLMLDSISKQEGGSFTIILCFIPLALLAAILFSAFYVWMRRVVLALAYKSAFRQD